MKNLVGKTIISVDVVEVDGMYGDKEPKALLLKFDDGTDLQVTIAEYAEYAEYAEHGSSRQIVLSIS